MWIKEGRDMFREILFYDSYTNEVSSTWWLYLLEGIALILLGILIILMPEILVGLFSGFLLFIGIICLAVAFRIRRLRKQYETWKKEWWNPITF
jgi:uncharacterized membrane protein HdeD (DUF308 family)